MHLDISFNKLREINLTPLAQCKDLKALHLYDNKLENIDLSVLSKCKKLRNLTLNNNEINSLDVSALFRCPNLMKLGLDEAVKLMADKKLKDTNPPRALKPLLGNIDWY
jgi:Leucine-rich repeat (LRR) protein